MCVIFCCVFFRLVTPTLDIEMKGKNSCWKYITFSSHRPRIQVNILSCLINASMMQNYHMQTCVNLSCKSISSMAPSLIAIRDVYTSLLQFTVKFFFFSTGSYADLQLCQPQVKKLLLVIQSILLTFPEFKIKNSC